MLENEAIIDARTLAFRLASEASIGNALAAYEADRRTATARLPERKRQTGPERVMQLAYERGPGGFTDITETISRPEREEAAANYKRATGFHPDSLNERGSLSAHAN